MRRPSFVNYSNIKSDPVLEVINNQAAIAIRRSVCLVFFFLLHDALEGRILPTLEWLKHSSVRQRL